VPRCECDAIAALTAGPWSDRVAQSDTVTLVGSTQRAGPRKLTSKGATRAQGASRGKDVRGEAIDAMLLAIMLLSQPQSKRQWMGASVVSWTVAVKGA